MSPASESKKYKLHGKILFGWPKKKPKKTDDFSAHVSFLKRAEYKLSQYTTGKK